MVANEVPLLYWKLTKTMRGPGAAAFVDMAQTLNDMAEDPSPTPDEKTSKFFSADTMRKVLLGYLARQQRDMRLPCPSCPQVWNEAEQVWVVGCKGYIVDAKRMGVRIFDEDTPEKLNVNSKIVKTPYCHQNDLSFFPGDELNDSRMLLRSVCGQITKKHYTNMIELATDDER
jgi:hypothetical protein